MPVARVKYEMTVDDACRHVTMSKDTLKKWLRDAYFMKAQPCPYGHAVLSEKGQWGYYIYPKRLYSYVNAVDLNPVLAEPEQPVEITLT